MTDRCPSCGLSDPHWRVIAASEHGGFKPSGTNETFSYQLEACPRCGAPRTNVYLGNSTSSHLGAQLLMQEPKSRGVPKGTPQSAESYLQQAFASAMAPDAAGIMAASAIEAMLKAKGYSNAALKERGFKKPSLYDRINAALDDKLLTGDLAQWANAVRLDANGPRHADEERPHLSEAESRQLVEFAVLLAELLFALPLRIEEKKNGMFDEGVMGTHIAAAKRIREEDERSLIQARKSVGFVDLDGDDQL